MASSNPLLSSSGGLPAFRQIKAQHVEPAITTILAENRAAIDHLLEVKNYSWSETLQPLEELQDRVNRAWSPVRHLHSVADSECLRAAYNACLPLLSEYATELGQNEDLYKAYKDIKHSPAYRELGRAEKKIIDNALRDFRLSGIELNAAAKKRYKEIQLRLSQLQTKFEENVLDATQGWYKLITAEQQLAGLPESAKRLGLQLAERKNLSGWVYTLDFPAYMPVMTYANDRGLRYEMYHAYMTRASEQGPAAGQWDNSPIMTELLSLRQELAKLLGFASFAEYSLATKMAHNPDEVLGFLEDLARRSKPVAERELAELKAFAREHYAVNELEAWDVAYFSEKLRQHRYAISQEELRPYFPAAKVIAGLFAVVERLYGIVIRQQREGVETWHPDVLFYDIYDNQNTLRGGFYLDLYARENKRGGAWMDECLVRKHLGDATQLPIAYLSCNFSPPVGEDPALLTHTEVITLFHEFGHGLHHMLTLVDYPSVAGINGVPWDGVELPSQFMENWCWAPEALALISGHYQTGEPIGPELLGRMLAAKNFQSGLQMMRQLEFALFDFRLHRQTASLDSAAVQNLLDTVREQTAVLKPPAFNRFQHGFTHIFAGGYAAGYYSYKWAEVLSADAYSRFEETGIFNRATGQDFLRLILESGGTRDFLEAFVDFRGRKPDSAALLRHTGIME